MAVMKVKIGYKFSGLYMFLSGSSNPVSWFPYAASISTTMPRYFKNQFCFYRKYNIMLAFSLSHGKSFMK